VNKVVSSPTSTGSALRSTIRVSSSIVPDQKHEVGGEEGGGGEKEKDYFSKENYCRQVYNWMFNLPRIVTTTVFFIELANTAKFGFGILLNSLLVVSLGKTVFGT